MADTRTTVLKSSLASLVCSWRFLALASVGAFGLGTARFFGVVQVILLTVGILLLLVSILLRAGARPDDPRSVVVMGVGVIALFSLTTLSIVDDIYVGTWPAVVRAGLGVISIVGSLWHPLRSHSRQMMAGLLIIWIVTLLGLLTAVAIPDSKADVQYGHQEASRLLFSGVNPYSDMVIRDTAPPNANEGVIVGYSYSPVSLIVFSVAERVGDSRFASAVLIGILMTMVFVRASRYAPNGVVLVGVLATLPYVGGLVIVGWTEPLQAVLIIAAAFLYRRWFLSSVLLGLAIASKQYMLLAVIPLLVVPDPNRSRRVVATLGVAGAVYLPFFLWNPVAMWNALIGHQLERIARSDVSSLWGVGVEVPTFVAIVLAMVLGVAVARRTRSTDAILAVQALMFAVFFVLSPNIFLNFWFLVAAMVVGVVAAGSNEDPSPASQHGESSGTSDAGCVAPRR